jgi:hypothetical protein
MSRQAIIVIGAVVLLVVIAGVSLYVLLQSNAPAMADGPGMLYFYSPV